MQDDYLNLVKLPLLPLRGIVAFPDIMMTFDVERPMSVSAINHALSADRLIFLAAQKDIAIDSPKPGDLYTTGTVCRVRQQLRQPKSSVCRVMVEGLYKAEIIDTEIDGATYFASVLRIEDSRDRTSPARIEAMVRKCMNLYEEYVRYNPDAVSEQILNVLSDPSPEYIVNYIVQNIRIPYQDKQTILEERTVSKRLADIIRILSDENEILALEQELNEETQKQIALNQRDYYLREELKIIQSELGEDFQSDDFEEYKAKIEALPVTDSVREKLLKEVKRLAKQPFGSSEAAVLRTYLDTCLELPWGKYTEERLDLEEARKILDAQHYGLEKVKERVIEYLAMRKLNANVKGGLLCLVGPPGTGKTSIAMSIADATNRKLVRVSLGGVHDEAEIRGHRKTYIGSMPGRIISGIIQSGSCNPVMVLDEIDKLGSDYRGDPASALLEVFDAEQNTTFRDNFIEIPFDLSSVFFITTANTLDTVPRALLDRMEVIELGSYTDEEKVHIAKNHLIPKQRKKHGLNGNQLRISDNALRSIIRSYTRESGVRVLERELAAACRKAAAGIASGQFKCLSLKPENLESVLGPAKYKPDRAAERNEVGLVHGLAYTSAGGEVLDVEAAVFDGTGKIEMTGSLGDVMKESVRDAVAYLRSKADLYGINPDFYKTKDIYIHFPETAVPKDGPSAGCAVCTAVFSALTGLEVRCDIAMTGEISLRGRVLPIGGLKEKTMAAKRYGVKTVIIPRDNLTDLEEIDGDVRKELNFITADSIDEVLSFAVPELFKDMHNSDARIASQPNISERPKARYSRELQ